MSTGIPEKCITLGDHIRKTLIERSQSQSDLAKMFNVTTDTVTNWELNRGIVWRKYYPIIKKYLDYLPEEYELSTLAYKLVMYRWEHDLSLMN